jgi:hypothetical protein
MKRPKGMNKQMARFMERQIDQVQKRFAGVIRIERRSYESPTPDHQ